MTWTNAFDVGECTVVVVLNYAFADHEVYRGVMAKGGSNTFNVAALGRDYTVSVSADGVVTLDGAQSSGTSDVSLMALRVIPTQAPTAACRVRAIIASIGTQGTDAAWAAGNETNLQSLSGGGPWAPDPCVLTADPVSELSVWASAGGV